MADAAFVGVVEWHDVEEISDSAREASGTLFIVSRLWGEIPPGPIDIGRQQFLQFGSISTTHIWNMIGGMREGERVQVLVLMRGHGDDAKIESVIGPDRMGVPPPGDDLLAIQEMRCKTDGPELRERLVQAVLNPESSEMLWSWALGKLKSLETDTAKQFDLLLSPRIQQGAPDSQRIMHAVNLLTGTVGAECRQVVRPDGWSTSDCGPPPAEVRAVLMRLLGVLETTPFVTTAQVLPVCFLGQPALRAGFTDQEWADIRARFRAALENPEHPLHKVPEEHKAATARAIQRMLREPNPFAPTNEHP